jgi:hypothetical protein
MIRVAASLASRIRGRNWRLAVILCLALAHSLVYVFVMPPWQHYDEPNHFEYVWWLADRRALPQPTDYHQAMRRAVAESMIAHGFFRGMDYLPDLDAVDQPIWIGAHSQLTDPPLYYALAALPAWLARSVGVDAQLYAARGMSVLLYLLSVWAAWGVVKELTGPGNWLRWLTPLTLALLPGYVELMSAVNNDVGAAAFFALFLWGALRLVRRGFTWIDFVWALAACLAGLLTKRTTFVAVPLLGLALLLALFPARRRKWVWVFGGIILALGMIAIFDWGDAWLWYRKTSQSAAARLLQAASPVGQSAFRVEVNSLDAPSQLIQIIPTGQASQMSGNTLTLGAWMWASRPAQVLAPTLVVYDGDQVFTFTQPVAVTTTPQFFAISLSLTGNTTRSWVILDPRPAEVPLTVYYDGLTLAEGDFTFMAAPVFADPRGERGRWGGAAFENLLRNASAEQSGPWVRPWVDALGSQLFSDFGQDRLSLAVYSLVDLPATGWYYRGTLENLLRTFWAKFGWGHVALLGGKPYRILAGATLLGLIGALLALWQGRRTLPWHALLWLGLALGGVWALTLIRGSNYILLRASFLANGRYTYPVIIPAVLVLNAGWLAVYRVAQRRLRLPAWGYGIVYGAFFLGLDVLALASVVRYYANSAG